MKKLILLLMMGSFLACSTSYEDENTSTIDATGSQKLTNVKNGTVFVGTQKWMLKNLDVSTYRNGDVIPEVTDNTEWAALTTGAWRYYNDYPANGVIYGKLYNWYAVNDPRGLAPNGYHIPTHDEWTILANYLGGEDIAGGAMKETGLTHWNSPNGGATNSSGFTGLPSGDFHEGMFTYLGYYGQWWSSTVSEDDTARVRTRFLNYESDDASHTTALKNVGLAVRCVKN